MSNDCCNARRLHNLSGDTLEPGEREGYGGPRDVSSLSLSLLHPLTYLLRIPPPRSGHRQPAVDGEALATTAAIDNSRRVSMLKCSFVATCCEPCKATQLVDNVVVCNKW